MTIDPSSDLVPLVRRMASGDDTALALFYDATAARVYGLVSRMLRDANTAEEVTQDVYLQAWRNAVEFDTARGNPLAWLLMMARSRALDRLRRERHRSDNETTFEQPIDSLVESATTPLDTDPGQARRVRAAIARLSPAQQRALLLAFYRGMSHSEIAAATALPLGTVKTHVRSALLRLRELLKDEAP